jgi:hypothetical protein
VILYPHQLPNGDFRTIREYVDALKRGGVPLPERGAPAQALLTKTRIGDHLNAIRPNRCGGLFGACILWLVKVLPRYARIAWESSAWSDDGLLELAPSGKLRYACRGDLHTLPCTRVDTLTRGTIGGRELAEPSEVDVTAAAQRVGDGVEERIDRPSGIPPA